jgi:hypothetical protein
MINVLATQRDRQIVATDAGQPIAAADATHIRNLPRIWHTVAAHARSAFAKALMAGIEVAVVSKADAAAVQVPIPAVAYATEVQVGIEVLSGGAAGANRALVGHCKAIADACTVKSFSRANHAIAACRVFAETVAPRPKADPPLFDLTELVAAVTQPQVSIIALLAAWL